MSTALILGASGDIGTATAHALAEQGWSLYLHFHNNEDRINTLTAELAAAYPHQDFLTVRADLTDVQSADAIVQQLFSVDAVVVAAGMTYYELFADTTVEHLTNLLRVHLLTPMAVIRQLQDKLAVSGHGRIVFVGSVYGEAGSPMEVGYSTVKGAQSAFAHAYAQEVASLGITVNVVAPGAVDTKMNAEFGRAALDAVTADIPAQRLAQPADIAFFITTLLSESAGYLTGQTLNVTGGWLR